MFWKRGRKETKFLKTQNNSRKLLNFIDLKTLGAPVESSWPNKELPLIIKNDCKTFWWKMGAPCWVKRGNLVFLIEFFCSFRSFFCALKCFGVSLTDSVFKTSVTLWNLSIDSVLSLLFPRKSVASCCLAIKRSVFCVLLWRLSQIFLRTFFVTRSNFSSKLDQICGEF